MQYKLIVTEKAEGQLEHILEYLVKHLCVPESARKLLKEIEAIYDYLEETPTIYALCKDPFLASRGYRKATVKHFAYTIIYKIDELRKQVYILGIFHELENYNEKLFQ